MFTIKKADYLFWTFMFLMTLLQLSDDLTFFGALIFSIAITLTLRIHVIYVINKLAKWHLTINKSPKFIIYTSLACIFTALILSLEGYIIVNLILSEKMGNSNEMVSLFFGMLMVSVLISGGSYSIELFKQNVESEKRHEELKNSVLESEIEHLRTQLSPHFTFNILNNLHFLIRKDKEEALELLSRYSKILRYYVYESQNKWIKLDDEISFLKHYFQLETDRSGEGLQISCQWNIPENQLLIIPFLLSTFVENAFKHVSAFTDKTNYINLHVFLKNESQLIMKIENSTDTVLNRTKKQGVGLTYVQKRLNLSYLKNYKLYIEPQENKYIVQLQLNLKR
ncbi:histidine kinase [Flavobacterium jejuense]|uniref:Histidine kinase n=1 Tax=Flavobacterium jejuense TaxID=1544455 RepID=A0ABX0IZ27_9FLAO|nr:histidine kinase [Flavobacterium jejuense]NHN27251.1 histidine kinase [Flavobacterium jejuense]